MEPAALDTLIEQSLVTAVNYVETGRPAKALELIGQLQKVQHDHLGVRAVARYVVSSAAASNWYVEHLMGRRWFGEPLGGKSVEVFSDQGMGDLILLGRYLKLLKDAWDCRVVVNCYAFHEEMRRLVARWPFIDMFVNKHHKCDFHTNMMSLPALAKGLGFVGYPAPFTELLAAGVPPSPPLGLVESRLRPEGFHVGLAWHSNKDNPLAAKKSIPYERFAILEDGVNEVFSLLPTADRANFIIQLPINDLEDTAGIIAGCDAVVSVDTAALHLAGAMGKVTLGLLPFDADCRWGDSGTTPWYPTVLLYRQQDDGDWDPVIRQVKGQLEMMQRHAVDERPH